MRRLLQGLAVLALLGVVGAVNFLRPVDAVAASRTEVELLNPSMRVPVRRA